MCVEINILLFTNEDSSKQINEDKKTPGLDE
jgi:hypothetical protein